jgi:hypothetical protein
MYNILYVSYYPWSDQGSRYTNLALAFRNCKNVGKIIFSNPIDSIGNIRHILQKRTSILNIGHYRKLIVDPFPVYSCIAPVPFKESFMITKKMHNMWFAWAFNRLVSFLHDKKGILIIQKPSDEVFAMISIAKKNGFLTIFDWADLFEQFAGSEKMQKKMAELCRGLASIVDIVFCVSPYLKRIALTYNSKSFLIPNAVLGDSIAHDYVEIRDQETCMKSPRICYYGLINPVKLDYTLIREMADSRPNWKFIFIGSQIDPMNTKESLTRTNIEIVDPMDKYQLHNYIRNNIDICFNPYRMDDAPNNACSPMKLYETLGDGLPFITTDAFDPLDAKNFISIGKSAKDLISQIEYELENDSVEKRNQRISFAKKNTWEVRAKDMFTIVENV